MARTVPVLKLSVVLALALGGGTALRAADPAHRSPYAGQETRAIKNLSPQDIDDLRNGRGWGLAKPAELNGIPGPAHVLELAPSLRLTTAQHEAIQALFDEMNSEARRLGRRMIDLEAALNAGFETRRLGEAKLKRTLDEIGKVLSALRFVHLRTHLRTLPLLTPHQVATYSRLRGYAIGAAAGDPDSAHKQMH